MFNWLIVGAGFTGCTLAERIATQLGQKVLIIDRRAHVGGNAYDCFNDYGVLVHKYGPHIFHTNSSRIWNYLSKFTDWYPYYHRVVGLVDGKKVPIPVNLNSLSILFPESFCREIETLLIKEYGYGTKVPILKMRESASSELKFLADYIYEKVFLGYTKKQWDMDPEELSPSVTGRVPVHISRDDRYFQDTYQAMPSLGYSRLFGRMLDHENIKILLNADYFDVADEFRFERVIFTGRIDELCNYEFGELPYRSLKFEHKTIECDFYQEVGTINYPCDYDFTRITEMKHMTGQQHRYSTIITEYPQPYISDRNEPYYPIPCEDNRKQYRMYKNSLDEGGGRVLISGRLGDYKYYNMDQAVAAALKLFESEVAR